MKKILLVEDDPEITKLLKLHFNTQSYDFFSCVNGGAALKKVKNEHFDLIIPDITLPDINGMELCKTFREENSGILIMMLTSHIDEADNFLLAAFNASPAVYMAAPSNRISFARN